MRTKHWLRIVGLALVIALVAAACGGDDTESTETTEGATESTEATDDTEAPDETTTTEADDGMAMAGTVTVWHGWTETEIESLNEVIAGFNAAYPDVTVETLFVPFEELQNKVTTEWGAGEGPTVLIGATDWASSFLEADVIYDMNGLVSDDVIAGIVPSALPAVDFDGVYAGLPQTLKGVVMYRNAALLPEAPASLADIIAAGDANLERGFFFSMAHLSEACGGAIVNEDGTPAFNTPEGVCWFELVDSFPAVAGEWYTDNDVDTFKQGATSVIIDGTWNAAGLADAIGAENLVIDPWPTAANGNLSGVVQTESIYIGNNTMDESLDAAVAFTEHFLGAEAQTILADPAKAGHIPAISGVEVEGAIQSQALAAFESGITQPRFGGCFWGQFDAEMVAFLEGQKTAEEALATAEENILAALDAGECN